MKDVVKSMTTERRPFMRVSVQIEPEEFAYIVGPSGAGSQPLFDFIP